jgi:hypothetical protein
MSRVKPQSLMNQCRVNVPAPTPAAPNLYCTLRNRGLKCRVCAHTNLQRCVISEMQRFSALQNRRTSKTSTDTPLI